MGPITSLVTQVPAVTAAGPAELRPVAPWSVEYAPSMCVLSRGFGGTVQQPGVTLALRPLPLSTSATMIVATPSPGAAPSRRGKLVVTLFPSGERRQVPFQRGHNATKDRALTEFEVPTEFLDLMRTTDAVEIAIESEAPVRLATGPAAKALAALVPCQDDLLKSWGYDPAIKDRIGTPAKPVSGTVATAFSSAYYPPDALRQNQEGRTTIAWTIKADGRTKDCRILNGSGVKDLDLTTCAVILQKLRFKPALDRDGKPMVSYQTEAVRWSISP